MQSMGAVACAWLSSECDWAQHNLRLKNIAHKVHMMHNAGTASQASWSSLAGMSHTAYIACEHWFRAPYTLKDMCTQIVSTDEIFNWEELQVINGMVYNI